MVMTKFQYKNSIDPVSFAEEEQKVYQRRRSEDRLIKGRVYDLIDAFSGAGGMTLGFTKSFGHSFRPVWANDFNTYCVDTYNANFGKHCVAGDIVDLMRDSTISIPSADVVIGGPPCQGFSLLNKNRETDPRKKLWKQYFEVVIRANARIFVMENVPQLLGSEEFGEIVSEAKSLGFKVWAGTLTATDYGVPQARKRAFIVGCSFADPISFFPPRPTHYNPKGNSRILVPAPLDSHSWVKLQKYSGVRDAIGDLPEPVGTEIRKISPPLDLHFGRNPTELSKKRYRAIPIEGMNRFDLQKNAPELTPACWIRKKTGGTDLFGRLWWDRPSVTIRTEFFKPEKGRYLHPTQHRPITHREAARLQSFPDSFSFTGSKLQIAKQIGNAVPPLLAARVADIVYTLLMLEDGTNG